MKKGMLLLPFLLAFGIVSPAQVLAADHSGFKDSAACYECHGSETISVDYEGEKLSLYVDQKKYEDSVHGTVDCLSCHSFDGAPVYGDELRTEVSKNCANCHTGAGFRYDRGVHSESPEGANCVDCHGAHEITPVTDPLSPVASQNLDETCGECHSQVTEEYSESFHGKAAALGAVNSPDCTDCHGSHQILSLDNKASLTSPDRKSVLCARCHEGSGALGVGNVEHYTLSPKGDGAPMYWVKKVFMWLILLVVGFFLIHILLDLGHKLRTRKS